MRLFYDLVTTKGSLVRQICQLAVGCLVAILAASTVSAAIVNYSLDLYTPGTFKLYAGASTIDNFGIASYGVALTVPSGTTITSFDHSSINTPYSFGGSVVGP